MFLHAIITVLRCFMFFDQTDTAVRFDWQSLAEQKIMTANSNSIRQFCTFDCLKQIPDLLLTVAKRTPSIFEFP